MIGTSAPMSSADDPIPADLRAVNRWITWLPIPDTSRPGKTKKLPTDPRTGTAFEKESGWQADPTQWVSYAEVIATGRLIGFVLGDSYAGMDIDDCRDAQAGKIEPWVVKLVQGFNCYTEVSPSSTGIKAVFRGTLPDDAEQDKRQGIELYDRRRFFTITGRKLPYAPSTLPDRTNLLRELYEWTHGRDLVALCKLKGFYLDERKDRVYITCPWIKDHSGATGEYDTSLQLKDGEVIGFHCFHSSHATTKHRRDVFAFFGLSTGLDHPLTEAGDAECFAEVYQEQVRYDHRRGRWLVSDETSGIWVPDPVEQLTQMTVEMMRARQRQSLTLTGDAKKKAAKWTIEGEARKRVINALALARSVPPLADAGEHWDEHPFLLGCQNGVIDLETGRSRKATPADRVTMRVRAAYDPQATCPLWLKTLSGIFAPAGDLFTIEASQLMIAFLQRALGYSITGDCREECCFFTWGSGGNGKGTMMNTLGWLLGDYTDDLPYSTLERSEHGSGIPNDIAKLAGKRFITCAEVNEFNLNESRLKALTGRDPMTGRFLHHEFFTFIPVCKIWIATNHKPKIVGTDDGIWRRIHLIPFTQTFEGRENKQLKDQLRQELPGILNWIIEGARLWIRDGLQPPETVKVATAAYRQESNPITPFVDACCVTGEKFRVQASLAFEAYETFCRDEHLEAWRRLSNKAFYKAMEQRFTRNEVREKTRQVFYTGVGLLAPAATCAKSEEPANTPVAEPESPDDKHFADQDDDSGAAKKVADNDEGVPF